MVGEAGFEKVQDCKVLVTLRDKGGVEIKLHSKLEKMFGKTIIESVKEELNELGVKHAEVEIFDFSSLDFVIRARVKTAVERARSEKNE